MAEELEIKCTFCEKKQQFMKLCSRCKAHVYCSKECQIKDWPTHKTRCNTLEKPINQNINENCHSSSKSKKDTTVAPNDVQTINESCAKMSSSCIKADPKLIDKTSTDNGTAVSDSSKKGNEMSIYIKHNKVKSELKVNMISQDGDLIYQQISNLVQIPVGKLKLVCKGKIITPENIATVLHNKAVFLALGEVAENEDGIDSGDIETLMRQLNVERNVAVRALKKTGSLLDAIFDVGNNL